MRKVKKFFEKQYTLLRLRIDMNKYKNRIYNMQEILNYAHDGLTIERATKEIEKAQLKYSLTKMLYDSIKRSNPLD